MLTHAGSPIVDLVSMSPYEPCLADLVGCVLLYPLALAIFTVPLLWWFPWLHLLFECGSLHLILSFAGLYLYDDNCDVGFPSLCSLYHWLKKELLWAYSRAIGEQN